MFESFSDLNSWSVLEDEWMELFNDWMNVSINKSVKIKMAKCVDGQKGV